ncbi:MAG: thioredoxin domain-containing protein [Candidatus Nanohalobium sp.]
MPTEVTADNIDDVKNSDEYWILDFWAEWCVSPDSVVYANEAAVSAGSLEEKGHKVFSFNQITGDIERSNVSEFAETNTENMARLVTETGRSLEVAEDHEVYTQEENWKKVKNLDRGEKIAVLPVEDQEFETSEKDEKILTGSDISSITSESMRERDYISELEEKRLLPLKLDEETLPLIARITGFLFSDGTLYSNSSNNQRTVEFSLGKKEDVEELQHGLEKLGFDSRAEKKESKFEIDGREVEMNLWRVRCSKTSLFLLFKALGVPEGRKTDKEYEIPSWVMEGPENIKREFLRGFIGGNGPKPAIGTQGKRKGDYNSFLINDLEFHKKKELGESGLKFGRQLEKLFNEFGVTVRSVEKGDEFDRKDGSKSIKIKLKISDDLESFYNYTNKLRPAYAHTKEIEFLKTGEYARKRIKKHEEASSLKQQAAEMREKGLEWDEIAEKIGKKKPTVYGWVKKDKNPLPKNESLYNEWLEKREFRENQKLLTEKVEEIESLEPRETISMEIEGTHNYFANGILTHNCGPCKKLAPIFKEVSEEIEDVNFGKVDMEEQSQVGTQFGVRALPTLLILKDGEEVARTSGAMPKNKLKNWIKENTA